MNYVKLIIFVFVFILAVSFAAKNAQPITLAYYFNWETRPFPMYLLIFIPFFIGTVVGSPLGFSSRLGLKNTVKRLTKSNRELEEKLKQAQEAQISREYETAALEEKPMETEVIPTQ
ncbi:MAG: lipopolysaccharide assembly LapA domain-containing protein [Thermodesulfobacteriota bacterium]